MPTTVTSTPQPGSEERRISPESLRLPHALEEEEGEFVAIIKITSKPGRSDELEGLIRAIHEETDENELDVYSHRILRGYYDEDLDTVCIVIEYNTNASFYSHHRGKAIKRLYASDCVCELEPPVLSFWRDVHW